MHKADTKFLSNCKQSLLRYQYFYLITAAHNNSQPHIMKHFITQLAIKLIWKAICD